MVFCGRGDKDWNIKVLWCGWFIVVDMGGVKFVNERFYFEVDFFNIYVS